MEPLAKSVTFMAVSPVSISLPRSTSLCLMHHALCRFGNQSLVQGGPGGGITGRTQLRLESSRDSGATPVIKDFRCGRPNSQKHPPPLLGTGVEISLMPEPGSATAHSALRKLLLFGFGSGGAASPGATGAGAGTAWPPSAGAAGTSSPPPHELQPLSHELQPLSQQVEPHVSQHEVVGAQHDGAQQW